jgi:hypothetical protein
MAPNATHHSPGRMGRVLHWLFPSRRCTAAELAIEVLALVLQVPLAAHLLIAVAAHLAIELWRRR